MDREEAVARLYQLLTAGAGVQRTVHPALADLATQRAYEARQQVGLTGTTPIAHPPQSEREARLGSAWLGAGVVELATWNYQWSDPVQSAVSGETTTGIKVGLLNTEPHRSILVDSRWKHWGIGVYDELPAGQPEIERRLYVIVEMSVTVPIHAPDPVFVDVKPGDRFYADIMWMAKTGITSGVAPDYTHFKPAEAVSRGQMAAFLHRFARKYGLDQ